MKKESTQNKKAPLNFFQYVEKFFNIKYKYDLVAPGDNKKATLNCSEEQTVSLNHSLKEYNL